MSGRLFCIRSVVCWLLSGLFFVTTGCSAPQAAIREGRAVPPFVRQEEEGPRTDYVAIPLSRGKQGQPLLEAQINGRPALFYLDTGAPLMCVDVARTRRFGLSPLLDENGTPILVNANGIGHRVTMLPSINLGPLQLQEVPAVLIDFREINRALRSVREKTSDAILGLQVMQVMGTVVDFEHSQLLVKIKPEGARPFGERLRRAGWIEVPMHINEGHLAVHARVNGARTRLVIDTGSPVSVLDRGFSNQRGIALSRAMFASQGINFRDAAVQFGRARSVRLGNYRLDNLTVAVFDLSRLLGSGGERRDPMPDGLIGCETLMRNRAYIDCEMMKLYLKPGGAKLQ